MLILERPVDRVVAFGTDCSRIEVLAERASSTFGSDLGSTDLRARLANAKATRARYPHGVLGTRTETLVATLRDLLAAEGVTWDLRGPSDPHEILKGMTDELHDLDEAGWADPASGPSPVIGRWLLVAIAADLQAETGLRLVKPQ